MPVIRSHIVHRVSCSGLAAVVALPEDFSDQAVEPGYGRIQADHNRFQDRHAGVMLVHGFCQRRNDGR